MVPVTTRQTRSLTCFNSLQTGKWIQRQNNGMLMVTAMGFQFPSNGKVDSELSLTLIRLALWQCCFNSLQTGKGIQSEDVPEDAMTDAYYNGFNSLQTGKGIQRPGSILTRGGSSLTCFNSLQTGKGIQRFQPR